MSAFTSARDEDPLEEQGDERRPSDAAIDDFPALPTETEIYILPDGRVIVADLPAELAALTEEIGKVERD